MTSLSRTQSPARGAGLAAFLRRLDQRPVHFALIAVLATALCFAASAFFGGFSFFDNFFLDHYFKARGAVPPAVVAEKLPHTKNIVLVETKYSVPRAVQVQILKQLRLAKVVAFDFMFVDEEKLLNEEEKEAPWYRDEIQKWRRINRELARVIAQDGNVVLGTWPEEEKVPVPGTGREMLKSFWETPPSLIWNSARYHAHVVVDSDTDLVTRTVHLFKKTNPQSPHLTPALGLAIAAAAMNISPRELDKAFVRQGVLHIGRRRIPVGRNGRMIINYVGGRDSFEYNTNHITYNRVLDYEPEDFKNKIVIIGESTKKSKEVVETPFGPMPGMQIHANIAATLLSAHGAPRFLSAWQIMLLSLAGGLLLATPLLRWPLWTSAPLIVALTALLFALGVALFVRWHLVLPPTLPLLVLAATYLLLAFYEYRRARATLGHFIGQEMVAPTLNVFSRLQPGGRLEEAAALFCDLRGYSALSERLSPVATNALINQYTGMLVKTVKSFGGRPIDYQGDGVFVLFERALAGPEYSWRAVQAALALQHDFQMLHETWKIEDASGAMKAVQIGIGIETGEMMIGLVGAQEHLKPGAVGDAVNVASRIQSLNTQCGFPIIITRTTWERIRENCERQNIPAVNCGTFSVRGRRAAVEVYGMGKPLSSVENKIVDNDINDTLWLEAHQIGAMSAD
jgi:class 3 adenylate cyclase/CHASE2 domain-containing sensor protein